MQLKLGDTIVDEFAHTELGDQRLTKRLCQLAEAFAQQPQASIPKATGDWGQACAAYRLLDNDKVRPEDLLVPHLARTLQRAAAVPLALAINDSTSLNYSERSATSGLGPIGSSPDKAFGLWLHNLLAFTPEGMALGMLDVQCWARDPSGFGSKHQRDRKQIEQKETVKWLRSLQALQRYATQTPQTRWLMVADREADLYELFALAQQQPQGPAVLVRAHHDRRLTNSERSLFRCLAQAPLAGQTRVEVARRLGQRSRTATLAVRFCMVRLRAPKRKAQQPSLTLWAVEARELHPPKGIAPLHWRLLTTLSVSTLREAVEKLHWYGVRWGIEVFHKVLKSGCAVEETQLRTAKRLHRYVAIKLVVAWRVMALTKLGREWPDTALNEILEEVEWRVLQALGQGRQKRSQAVPKVREGIRWLGRLGGHLGRRGDGAPGPLCLARGLQRLQDITAGWKLAQRTGKCA